MTDFLSREAILGASDLTIEAVPVPEWGNGATVNVRSLTAAERDRWENDMIVIKGRKQELNADNARARLLVMCICDERGKRLFRPGDAEALGLKNAAALQRLYDVAQRLSGITADDLEELTGKSEVPEPSAFSADSPSRSAG